MNYYWHTVIPIKLILMIPVLHLKLIRAMFLEDGNQIKNVLLALNGVIHALC